VLLIANIAWTFVWQRHQTIATLLAADYDVVFCEVPGMRRLRWGDAWRVVRRFGELVGRAKAEVNRAHPNVRIVRPFILPATNALFCAINGALIRRFVRRHAALRTGVELIFNYSPARTALQLIAAVPHRRLVYDCTDNFLAMRGIPPFLPDDERRLLRAAALTLVPSRELERLKRPDAKRVVRLPHGALVDRFAVPDRARSPDEPLRVLYYGHLHRQHLDYRAIHEIALTRPTWEIVLVGPVKSAEAFPANVILPGQQPHEHLREWIGRSDVLILPYVVNEYTRSVLPAKTYECLATGRPIVASPLPELTEQFSAFLRFASAPDQWVEAIETEWRADTPERRSARRAIAQQNRWEDRYVTLRRLLDEFPATDLKPPVTR